MKSLRGFIGCKTPFLFEFGDLGFRAVLGNLNLRPRSAHECRAIAGGIMLKNAKDIDEPIEIAQIENRSPLIRMAECI